MSKLPQRLLPIKVDLSAERLTSMTGLVLVEELGRAKGLWRRVDELFGPPGSGRGYQAACLTLPLSGMGNLGRTVYTVEANNGRLARKFIGRHHFSIIPLQYLESIV